MKTSIVVAGDMLIQRRICPQQEGFRQVADHIQKADARCLILCLKTVS